MRHLLCLAQGSRDTHSGLFTSPSVFRVGFLGVSAPMAQESFAGGAPITVIENRLIVMGGHLKKPFVPKLLMKDPDPGEGPGAEARPLRVNGHCFIALSRNDYALGKLIFGKVNSPDGRNLSQTEVINRLWLARNKMQEQLLAQWADKQTEEEEDALLDGIFGDKKDETAWENTDKTEKRTRRKTARENTEKKLASMQALPQTLELSVPSSRESESIVTFVVARSAPDTAPAIECTPKALEALSKECWAEVRERLGASPSTPPRRGKRRAGSMVRSPSTGSPKKRRKKKFAAQIHHDKKLKRVLARWKDEAGIRKSKSFPLQDNMAPREVEDVKELARAHARERHYRG